MTTRRDRSAFGGIVVGLILIVVGGFYVLTNLVGVTLNWDAVWPLLIVGLGVLFLARAMVASDATEPPA
ncbi:MAG TPA: hypothetical protein VFP83_04245 [Candidatus Limnocylindria bacterium]|nr:hypothetical protein [Candidatus Limnocylindria bacterium]